MSRLFHATSVSLVFFTMMISSGFAAGQSLPRIGGKEAVATVNGEPITSDELNRALGIRHAEMRDEKKKAGKVDYSEVLNRLVNIRLILLEARNIGLDELPEVKEAVDDYSRGALMQVLLKQQTSDISVAEDELDAKYKELVKEYKLQSLLFGKEEDAKRFVAEIGSGQDYQKVAGKFLEAGTAKGREEASYVKSDDLLPEIRQAISKMSIGSTSPGIKIGPVFTILKLEEVRHPENPAAKEQAREILFESRKFEKTQQYMESLKKEYVVVKQEVLDSLDYEVVSGFKALLEDPRVVAEVKGEEPVTVGQLSMAIEKKFFHGVEKAAGKKTVNSKKEEVLRSLLNRRVLRKEALRLGLDKTDAYRETIREYENSLIFEVFLVKVIRPGIRLEEKDLKEYYEKHISEFSSPEMMRIDSIAFTRKARAKEAMHKLNEGADFTWVGANAEGQVDNKAEDLLRFDGKLITVNGLPMDVQKALSGGKQGDLKLYESPEGYAYLLSLREVIPSTPQPLEEVAGQIAGKVTAGKTKQGVQEYAGKLRNSYPVKIFIEDLKP